MTTRQEDRTYKFVAVFLALSFSPLKARLQSVFSAAIDIRSIAVDGSLAAD
jgi:hypothetical protein